MDEPFNPIIIQIKQNFLREMARPLNSFNPIIVQFKPLTEDSAQAGIGPFNPIIVQFKRKRSTSKPWASRLSIL